MLYLNVFVKCYIEDVGKGDWVGFSGCVMY